MRRNSLTGIIIATIGLIALSCSHNEVHSEFKSFPKAVWARENPALFNVDIADTSAEYSVLIEIRNNDEYPFQNLWLFIDVFTPAGDSQKDTVDIELADVYGKWHGKGLSLYTFSFPLKASVQYPDTGRYTYRIRQGMRQDDLPGISDIGLRILKNTQ